MLNILSLFFTLFLDHYTSELAGMSNVILRPSFVAGARHDVTFTKLPSWHNSLDLYAIYGSALAGHEIIGQACQEVRGEVTSLYTFYKNDNILTL